MLLRIALVISLAIGSIGLVATPAQADTRIHYAMYGTFGSCENARLNLESSGRFYDGVCAREYAIYWVLYITRKEGGGGGGVGSWG
ncbi:hypothetical protein BI335_08415 [Enemella evansiae]|nr:hypothetical protein BI335_08415 [Enemella evansiae]